MTLKKITLRLVLLLFVGMPLGALAQNGRTQVWNLPNYDRNPLHFGFSLGASTMNFSMRHANDFLTRVNTGEYAGKDIYSVEASTFPGFHLGGLVNFRLNDYFDFRTLFLLSFAQRDLNYQIRQIRNDEVVWTTDVVKIESINTQLPLLLKLKSHRVNNYRPFFIAGINPTVDLAAGSKEDEPYVHLAQFDLLYEAGFGVDFYLYYFKFATELKYSFGINDMLKKDGSPHSESIGELYTHMFTLSFNFE